MSDAGEAKDREQDPRVETLRPDPAEPPLPVRTLEGLWGKSDRPEFRRLYLTSGLDAYAEFRVEDVVQVSDIPPERPPFLGERATRVALRVDAQVDLTRSRRAGAINPFDLDLRFRRGIKSAELPIPTADLCPLCGTVPDATCEASALGTCFGQTCPEEICAEPPVDVRESAFVCPRP
jgi:hypothetical protein